MSIQALKKDTIAILGLGKVGTAIGFLLKSSGYTIVSVASRSDSSINRGIIYTGGKPYKNFSDAAAQAECILITTSDDVIASVCENISSKGSINPGKKVIHMSGAGGLNLLESALNAGADIACIHPLQSFADVEGAIKNIPGSTFGITAEEKIKEWSVQMVRHLGGIPFFVSDIDKPIYHIAACIASNYLTTLMHMVTEIYRLLGLNGEDAIRAFWPLVKGTMSNIETKGTIQALTGPVSRGDIGTIEKHIDALRSKMPSFIEAYSILGILTADLGLEKKTLSVCNAELIKKIFEGGRKNEQTSQHE